MRAGIGQGNVIHRLKFATHDSISTLQDPWEMGQHIFHTSTLHTLPIGRYQGYFNNNPKVASGGNRHCVPTKAIIK